MDPSDAYEVGKYIPDAACYAPRWAMAAAAFRDGLGTRALSGLTYGPADRQRFDLFLPVGNPVGLVVFIHGGYWKAFDRTSWSHLAAGPVGRGWVVAMPSYTLAPVARITEITHEIAAAVTAAAKMVAGPVVVTGHSAGGHLAARMRCADVPLAAGVAGRLARIVPISPLSDLRPLMRTAMNTDLRLDVAEARDESPVLHSRLHDIETVVWVGAEERPAFLDQARWLADTWPQTALQVAPGRHHFDVIEELAQSDSPLVRALLP